MIHMKTLGVKKNNNYVVGRHKFSKTTLFLISLIISSKSAISLCVANLFCLLLSLFPMARRFLCLSIFWCYKEALKTSKGQVP